MGLRVSGLGFRVEGLGFRVEGSQVNMGLRVSGFGFRENMGGGGHIRSGIGKVGRGGGEGRRLQAYAWEVHAEPMLSSLSRPTLEP